MDGMVGLPIPTPRLTRVGDSRPDRLGTTLNPHSDPDSDTGGGETLKNEEGGRKWKRGQSWGKEGCQLRLWGTGVGD